MLCRAELSNWDFAVLGAGVLRNALAVVGAVDIHLAAAIGTITVSYTHLHGRSSARKSVFLSSTCLEISVSRYSK